MKREDHQRMRWRKVERDIAYAWIFWRGFGLGLACGLLVFWACGCATLPTAARPVSADPYVRAWVDAGFPLGDCGGMQLRVHRFTDRAALHRACDDTPNNCMRVVDTGLLGLGQRYYVLNVNCCPPPPTTVRRVIAHEVVHALAECAGVPDVYHYNPPRFDGSGERWLLWSKYDEALGRMVLGFEERAWEVTAP
jgi:hypothetical protein